MIDPNHLQELLRQINTLSGCSVEQRWPAVAPHMVVISGAINIHGKPFFWEVEQDLRNIDGADAIARFIHNMQQAFGKAEAGQTE